MVNHRHVVTLHERLNPSLTRPQPSLVRTHCPSLRSLKISHNKCQIHYSSISNPQTLHPAPVSFRQNLQSVLATQQPPSKPSPISNYKLSSRLSYGIVKPSRR